MRRSSFFIFLFGLFPFLAVSQESLTLEDAIRIGLENSYSIKISKNNIQIAQNNNTLGNAGFLPRVDVSGSQTGNIQERYQENSDGTNSTVTGFPTNTTSAGALLSWTVFDGMSMFLQREKLEIYSQQSELSLRIAVENTVADIAYTYYNIALNEKLYNSLKDQMALSRQRLRIAHEKSKIGVGNELQELQSEVDYRADSARYLQQKSYLVNLKAELNRLLTREANVQFSVYTSIPVPQVGDVSEILQEVLDSNPQIAYERLQNRLGELDYNQAKSPRFPRVNVSGAYNFSNVVTPDAQQQVYRTLGPAFGVNASIALFDGFNTSRKIRNAQILVENQRLSYDELILNLQSNAFKLVNNLNQAIELVKVEEKSVELAQRNTDTAWEKYRLGAISDIELRESQNKLLDAQTRLISAQLNAQAAEIEINLLTGEMNGYIGAE
ncbi:MAG TPA: TolC family protein [Tenuifilaceae bacterium]|nr:TolC family protein [Tenuifilaceae bacterium]HPE18534.1 TolC family protein [Tenuifilaceae bacterium]HPJ45922.1 TolC family protein [Tenuifilaceae bacterium]HPQ35014.1 TolC family protein [Tenuifilaceae bacterium]